MAGRKNSTFAVTKVRLGDSLQVDTRADTVAGEEPLEIRAGGQTITTTMRTPGHDIVQHALTALRALEHRGAVGADEGTAWGFWNAVHPASALEAQAQALARRIAAGPTFAHGITKTQLNQEWNMSLDQAIEAEAQAQAICMQTRDFERAYRAFVAKDKPVFQGD